MNKSQLRAIAYAMRAKEEQQRYMLLVWLGKEQEFQESKYTRRAYFIRYHLKIDDWKQQYEYHRIKTMLVDNSHYDGKHNTTYIINYSKANTVFRLHNHIKSMFATREFYNINSVIFSNHPALRQILKQNDCIIIEHDKFNEYFEFVVANKNNDDWICLKKSGLKIKIAKID